MTLCIAGSVKNGDVSPFLRKENEMSEELMNVADVESVFSDISTMIYTAKSEVMMRVNTSVISLYWNIGKKLSDEVLQGKKAEYGKHIIGDLSERLTAEYGKGFEKSSVFKMVKFYQEFTEYEKVATLSQQLTWSHFVELLIHNMLLI